MSNTTAGIIADRIGVIMRTNRSSTDLPALQDTFVYALIDAANREYLRAFRRGSGSEPLVASQDTGFSLVTDTTLNGAVSAGASNVVLTSSTGFVNTGSDYTNGAAVIWEGSLTPDPFFYALNTPGTNTFSGCTKVSIDHVTAMPVQFLYKLPTDFSTFRPADLYGDGVQLNGIPMRFREGPPVFGYFSMIDNGTNKFLWFSRGSSGKCSVLYEKLATTITQSSDIIDIETDFEWFAVWKAVQTICFPEGDSSELYGVAKAEANRILADALQLKDIGKYARVRQFPRLNRRQYDPALFLSMPR